MRGNKFFKLRGIKACSILLGGTLVVMLAGCASSAEQSASKSSDASAVVDVNALREELSVGNAAEKTQESSAQQSFEQQSQSATNQEVSSEEATADYDIQAVLAGLEAQEEALVEKLQEPFLTQMDMNIISEEIYMVWDDGLNGIWGKLKEVLSEEEMSNLTIEEREWIAYKDASAEEAGAECEGGSIYPLIINDVKAQLTKDRVYELAVYLGEKMGQIVNVPTVDFSGLYVDTQGTESVYSELELVAVEDRTYNVTIGLYRLTTLEGTAKVEGNILVFEDEVMQVKGEIFMVDEGAMFRATESEFEYILPGDVFEFPEKR